MDLSTSCEASNPINHSPSIINSDDACHYFPINPIFLEIFPIIEYTQKKLRAPEHSPSESLWLLRPKFSRSSSPKLGQISLKGEYLVPKIFSGAFYEKFLLSVLFLCMYIYWHDIVVACQEEVLWKLWFCIF